MPHPDRFPGVERALRVVPFLRSRLPTLLLWNTGLLAGAGVLMLSPGIAWQRDEALYALLLNLTIQGVWLALEAARRARLARGFRSDLVSEDGLRHSDTDIILAELRAYKLRLDRSLDEERGKHRDYGDYLVGWVHELKTPLTVLRLGLAGRREDRPSGARHDEDRLDPSAMLDEVDRIAFLLDQALFYARSHSFSADYLAKAVDLPELIRQLLARNASLCIQRRLRPRFGPGFAQAEAEPGDWRVVSDPVWLGFIFQQVLSNSVNYAPAGSELGFELERDNSRVRLCIDDQGPGVPPEELARIFDRGFTGQKRDRSGVKSASTGIGLYLVKKLSVQLGHDVWAESPAQPTATAPASPSRMAAGPGLRLVFSFSRDWN